jgi:hypothetical protein
MTIKEKFSHYRTIPSDINQHMETLAKYGRKCPHITEMGVRDVVSTWAWLLARPLVLRCYDIHRSGKIDEALTEAKKEFIDMTFTEADVLKIEIEPTNLLFIDTLHIYSQLKKELELHASKVTGYIIFHDTHTYWNTPEPASWQTEAIMENYKENDQGIGRAIIEFMSDNPQWKVEYRTDNNNGLMVISNV